MRKKKEQPGPRTKGIITSADSAYFNVLIGLVVSVCGKLPIAVVDAGLNDEQILELQHFGVVIIRNPPGIGGEINCRVKWEKPCYIQESPWDDSLWLDADCRVVGNLDPLWEKDPWVVQYEGNFPSGDNSSVLYAAYPVEHRLPTTKMINTGVSRWSRETMAGPTFQAWLEITRVAAEDVRIRNAITAFDEGCLVWAIGKTGEHDMVVSQPGWNRIPLRGNKVQPSDVIIHLANRTWERPGWENFHKQFIGALGGQKGEADGQKS